MRNLMAVAFAVLVLAAAAVGVGYVLTTQEEADPEAEVRTVLERYATAWEAWDATAMAEDVREPPGSFVALHQQFVEALAPTTTTVSPGAIELQGEGNALAEVTVAVELPRADVWEWTTELRVQRAGGEWAVLWEPRSLHPEARDHRTFATTVEEVERAPLLAHDGEALTSHGTLYEIGIEPRRVQNADELVDRFRELLPEGVAALERLLERDDLVPEWYYPVVTVREERFDQFWNQLRSEPGVLRKTTEGRVGTDDGFALHLLGRVAELTEDAAAERGPTYTAGDVVGAYGLEAAFDDRLTGSPRTQVVVNDEDGRVAAILHEYQGDPSEPVTTTLDADVQRAIENALVGVGDPAAIVAVDPATGGIRGTASRPLSGYNRAWEGRFPPGSTFKVVTTTAILEGDTRVDDTVACPAETIVGGLRIRNAGGLELGETSFEDAFAHSCNTSFAQLAADLDSGSLERAAERFGFGASYDLPLPAFTASFPEPSDLAERAAAAFGQGRVEASALHMATVAAAIASGTWHAPTIEPDLEPAAEQRLPQGPTTALRQLMRRVVTDGSGTAAAVDGLEVYGKTGSAEFGSGDPLPTHAWFIGFVSGGTGAASDLAFAVLLEGGGSGGQDAAPVAARFLRELESIASRPDEDDDTAG